MECKFCDGLLGENLIKGFQYWEVYLHPNQYYLGRCSVALKRHLEDLTEVTEEERTELFGILAGLRETVMGLFGANLINYYSAGNIVRHLHIHFIPRYDHEVDFEGVVFKDELWGQNHSFYPRDFKIEEGLLGKIKERIKSKI